MPWPSRERKAGPGVAGPGLAVAKPAVAGPGRPRGPVRFPSGTGGSSSPPGWLAGPGFAGLAGSGRALGQMAGWAGLRRGCPRWAGQPAACREGRRGSRRRPLTGPPADHGVMTPSRAGETISCYRPACGGTRAPGRGWAGPRPGPRPVDIGGGSGMVLRTVQHLASRQGELAARARLCHGPVEPAPMPGAARQGGPGSPLGRGLETGRAWAPSRQRRTSSLPAGRPPVRREARALFPRLPLSTAQGRLGA